VSTHARQSQKEVYLCRYLFCEMDVLSEQIRRGGKNVERETLDNVIEILKLLRTLLNNCEQARLTHGEASLGLILSLTERASRLAHPPLALLAAALACLCVLAKWRVPNASTSIWETLSACDLLPKYSSPVGDINAGLMGTLLAQEEVPNGEYPLTTAFLNLIVDCVKNDEKPRGGMALAASVGYAAKELLPSYTQWRFTYPVERQIFGQKLLSIFSVHLEKVGEEYVPWKKMLAELLLQPAGMDTLVCLSSIGDRHIKGVMELQSSWESGFGVELSRVVGQALEVLDLLLRQEEAGAQSLKRLSNYLCAPTKSGKEHFLQTVAHYSYHVHCFHLPVAAMKLLATTARIFPMSLLACLGRDAEAIRDNFIYRLTSQTEDLALKVALVDLFAACVETQPGFIQMLIDIDPDVSAGRLESKADNKSLAKVSGDQGCLKAVLVLMKSIRDDLKAKDSDRRKLEELHLSVVNFMLSLWEHQRRLATSYLKEQEHFWDNLTRVLFDDCDKKETSFQECRQVLRILSNEIFTYGGDVDGSGLLKVLDRLCEQSSGRLPAWNKSILLRLSASPERELDLTMIKPRGKEASVTLLAAWKAFLLVLSRDIPSCVRPAHCHLITADLVEAIIKQFSVEGIDSQAITSLSEFALVLVRRWQTKCAEPGAGEEVDGMADWCNRVGELLTVFAANCEEVSGRARSAILALCISALRSSSHKLGSGKTSEEDVLRQWFEPAAVCVKKAFREMEKSRG